MLSFAAGNIFRAKQINQKMGNFSHQFTMAFFKVKRILFCFKALAINLSKKTSAILPNFFVKKNRKIDRSRQIMMSFNYGITCVNSQQGKINKAYIKNQGIHNIFLCISNDIFKNYHKSQGILHYFIGTF